MPSALFLRLHRDDAPAALLSGILRILGFDLSPRTRANSGHVRTATGTVELSREKGDIYTFETTVGAGLPASASGVLWRAETAFLGSTALLSGTISYILTNGKARLFSQLVSAEAKEKVYTEPDPRDISGGRCPRAKRSSTSGSRVSLNYGDISIEPLLPAGLCRLHHRRVYGDAVRDRYRIMAPARRKPHRTARPPAMSLRITPTRPRFAQGIDSSSPLESLGTETCGFPPRNGIGQPLVVRGPGAGAEVTAGGVFADILKLAE